MNMNEMAAAVSANIPIVVLVFNNHVLGMVRQWQTLFYDHRYSHTTIDRQTDFVKLAEAFGGKGLRIQTRHDIKGVMKEALSSRVPALWTAGLTRMTVSIRSYLREKAVRILFYMATREMRA